MITNQNKQRKKKIKPQHKYFPGEILLLKTPLFSIVYSPRNHETITMQSSHNSLLHSHNCLTLIWKKSTNTQPIFNLCSTCLSCTIHVEFNPYSLGNSAFQNFTMLLGNPMDVLLHARSLPIIQMIANIPLIIVSTGSPLELTCIHLLIVNHQLHDRSLHVN